MDWGVQTGTATIVAIADGTASIYVSSGGGSIGGGQSHSKLRNVAQSAVAIAGELLEHMQRSDDSSRLPETGSVAFYVRTDSGNFTARASQELLSKNQHPMAKLGNIMQEIITEYRLIESSRN